MAFPDFWFLQNFPVKRKKSQTDYPVNPVPNHGFRAATAVVRDRGISDVTLWRWTRRSWIKVVNISGKNYVDLESLADFDRRAATGEFSRPPVGAAGASHKARREQKMT